MEQSDQGTEIIRRDMDTSGENKSVTAIAAEGRRGDGAGTLASTVYDRLRGDILNGLLPPGEKLRAEFLRDRYGVGNSPIREALNRLSVDGLVTRQDQKGFRVATVSEDELAELVRTRCWIEEIALRESIAHGDSEWEENVVLASHRLSRVHRSSDRITYRIDPEWERLHRAFHISLIAGCGSRWLRQFCEQLMDQADRYRLLAIVVSYPRRNELSRDEAMEHEAIREAVIGRNADQAVRLLCAHYQRTVEIIHRAIPELSKSGKKSA